MLQNEKKCFETNKHEKLKLKLFNRRLLLQDSKENIITFHKCHDIIPLSLTLQNISPKLSNISIVYSFLFFSLCILANKLGDDYYYQEYLQSLFSKRKLNHTRSRQGKAQEFGTFVLLDHSELPWDIPLAIHLDLVGISS